MVAKAKPLKAAVAKGMRRMCCNHTGGVDDKSFNQSSWEGLQAWGKEHDLPEGSKGYAYIQSNDAADYTTNIDQAVSSKFNTIFGIGYLLKMQFLLQQMPT